VLIDVFYGVDAGGTAMAFVLLMALGFVIAPYRSRLRGAVLLSTLPARPGAGALAALGIALLAAWAFTWWTANYNNRAPTIIDGAWTVASQGGAAADAPRWRLVFFERNRAHLAVMRAEGHPDRHYHFEIDSSGVVRIWQHWLRKGTLLMQGRYRPEAEIELESIGTHDAGRVVLRRMKPARAAP
jgi:hypothetical protein